MPPNVKVVVDILQNPYRPLLFCGLNICWGGVVLFRRTLLIVLSTFVQNTFMRLVLMFTVSLISLIHHDIVWPYHEYRANVAECISETFLVIISVINLSRSILDSLQQEPTGPTKDILEKLWYVDETLQLWLPLAGICILCITLMIRLLFLAYYSINHNKVKIVTKADLTPSD